jgi:[ribosomal protein S5]-alanine N-acetyltransferase
MATDMGSLLSLVENDIDDKNRHAMFGIFVGAAEARGKGYGTAATAMVVRYAFNTLNLNRVWLHVYEDNKPGIRVYEKVGFRKEGVLRQDNFRRGRYRDTIVMGILRADGRRSGTRRVGAADRPRERIV